MPVQGYGTAPYGVECISRLSFNESMATAHLTEAKAGDAYTVCVLLQENDCSIYNSIVVMVPATNFSIQQEQTSGTNYTITLVLPLTPHSPSELLIISSLSPPHDGPTTTTFPSSTLQHTVTFTDLTPGVEYTYIIRVVLANDSGTDVVPPATGSFSIPVISYTNTRQIDEVVLSTIVVVTLTVPIVIGCSLGTALVCFTMVRRSRKKRLERHNSNDSDSQSPADIIYEEISSVKDEIELRTNEAYEPVRVT